LKNRAPVVHHGGAGIDMNNDELTAAGRERAACSYMNRDDLVRAADDLWMPAPIDVQRARFPRMSDMWSVPRLAKI